MSEQLDLLEWAAGRQPCGDSPTGAQILDGRQRFERKAAAFFVALVRGYTPPFRDTLVIRLADRRESSRSAA
ncbi:hypothetical protein [Rhizobium leguminosarum]|uniref:hypothetical protein n=1 Tax=Rhizobium TaxID=379 RepID=UPI00103010F6|nr:hypothetical protein [Rhizobium leguminosarum]TAU91248.1 hypothetical protein ELI41_23260 [Rhizobium leguminosarum]